MTITSEDSLDEKYPREHTQRETGGNICEERNAIIHNSKKAQETLHVEKAEGNTDKMRKLNEFYIEVRHKSEEY